MKKFEFTSSTFKQLLSNIQRSIVPNKKYILTISEWSEKRSIDANAVYHVWVNQISKYTGEDLKITEMRCKRDHGLPILLAGGHGEVSGWMLNAANYYNMDDYSQLIFVSCMKVTRLFSTEQHNQFRDSVQSFWREQGLDLQYKKT